MKISSLALILWKFAYFSQNIWRSQTGLRTLIFGQFFYFDNLQAFTYLWQKFPALGSWHENWPFSSQLWKGQFDSGTRIFSQFLHFSDQQQ